MNEKELIETLCAYLGTGRLDNGFLLPALKELGEKSQAHPSSIELLEALQRHPGPALESLANHLRSRRRVEAARCLQRKKNNGPLEEFRGLLGDLPLNVPVGWLNVMTGVKGLRGALAEGSSFSGAGLVVNPDALIEVLRASAPALLPALDGIQASLRANAERLRQQAVEHLDGGPQIFPRTIDEEDAEAVLEDAFAKAGTIERKRLVLDAACSWPTSWMAGLIRKLGADPALKERAALLLTLRFDEPSIMDWSGWDSWLARAAEQDEIALNAYRALAAESPAELLLQWARDRADCPAEAREALELHCRQTLTARPKAVVPSPKPAVELPRAVAKPIAPPKPPEPEGPSLWDEHLLPFFAGNWPMLTGISMVVAGSSLLAYYTWDKHWLVRYTVLPVLLAAFTSALARIGAWIEKRDATIKGTADMLRGASVALLPANFMAVALLARDPQVTHKEILLPVFTLLYIAAAGRGLRRWCAAVHAPLGGTLALTLLGLNALVLLGPFLLTYAPQAQLWVLLGAGFHAGFLLMAWTIARFVKDELTPKLSEEGRVPWFLGVTLATTYIQVFLWVHGYLRHLPPAYAYSCLVVVAGGLVLFAEQCSRGQDAKVYGKDSFIGYALILLGLFMGASHPEVRTLSLALAGAIWMAQAVFRRELLHAWIAFTLIALSGGSAGLWDAFPRPRLPILTLGLAAAMGAFGRLAKRWWDEFVQVGARMQAAVLHITAVLAVLVQWHYRSAPPETAAVLLAAAALFAWRAHRDQKLVYVHTAMTVLAVTLPYLGFADISGRTLQGNTVVFGLSLLSLFWLILQAARPTPMIRGGRSTVLLIYGALAMTAMFLRVAFEQGRPDSALAGQAAMSLAGPLLMAAALVFAAYYSRSLLPIGMASLMVIILLPQLRREITEHLPFIEWGSGLMSALVAVALTWGCFVLRASPGLAALDEGDRFGGYAPFPLQRRDYRLFTWPLLASALFLLIKVNTWNFAGQLAGGGVHLKAALALIAAGLAWTLRAVYYRDKPGAQTYVHFGWLSAVAGLAFGYYDQAAAPRWHDATLLCVGALNALYFGYRYGLEPSRPWAGEFLAAPIRAVLRLASVGVALAVLGALYAGGEIRPMLPLIVFSSVQLAWFGLSDGDATFGTLLFFQTLAAILAWAAPGSCVKPVLLFLLVLQFVQLLLEFQKEAELRLHSLVAPLFFWCALAAFFAGLYGVFDGVVVRALTYRQLGLLLAVVLAAARAQGCGPLALLALLLGYLDLCFGALSGAGGGWARIDFLLWPWRFSAFALGMAALGAVGRWMYDRWPRLMKGPYGHGFFDLPARPWVFLPAMLFAAFAVIRHGLIPEFRHEALQLWTPYLAAAAFAVVGLSWRRMEPFAVAGLFLGLGNIHVVRFYLGETLRARGLGENHLFCLGAVATFGQFRLARLFATRDEVAVFLNRATLLAAGFVLALLTSTYFIHPDLEAMSDTRFLLSGVMAWLAGRCFQRAARDPDPGEAPYTAFFEGTYHYGVTTALWCFALLIPWFRNPYAAFPALGLPVLYFYARAELFNGAGEALVARYRNTAATLSFFLFALYAFRGAFQMVLFPQASLGVEHYHFNSPFIIILALVMFRLQGLGGTPWLGFYGGLAMMLGSYFLLTRLPGLSPFDFPIPSTWSAFGLGHFWMLFSAHASPPRTFLQNIGGVDDAQWEAHRSSWGVFLLAATQASLAWGLTDQAAHPYLVAPLFLGGASLLAHQAYIRGSVALYVFAAFEGLIALHADFFVTSYLPKDQVVWALIMLWAMLLSASEARPEGGVRKAVGAMSLGLGVLVMGHVLYHHPDSTIGLWAFAAAALLAALTPRPARKSASELESLAGGLLLAAPIWLVHFSQSRQPSPWPWLATTAALLATGLFARWVQHSFYASYAERDRNPRLFDQTLTALGTQGDAVGSASLYLVFGLTAWVQCSHYGRPFALHDLALMLVLYGVSAYAWFEEGRLRQTMIPYFMLQFCVIGFFAVIRRQLMLTLGWWNYEYDVWASLLVSFTLAGAKQILPLGPREARIPLLGTLLAMPVAVMTWVLLHGLGTDTVLLVVGLYSLMFAYMGKDERESPYHIVAMGGFVAFVLIVFWSKLELRALSAYVIPVGLGTLTLLQMFRDKISPIMRNEIRAITLLAMLGSAGYYALMDDRYPLYFHMTLLVVAVLAMAAGSLFRTRVYVLLGFAGLLTDLAALLYKLLIHMDRSSRMTLIGTQVLVFGTVLIVGAIYYKTNQDKLNEMFERWRGRLTTWE
ncbi:MAG: hypothetical protein ABL955_00030 [Elusimicrobiota bacterium]